MKLLGCASIGDLDRSFVQTPMRDDDNQMMSTRPAISSRRDFAGQGES